MRTAQNILVTCACSVIASWPLTARSQPPVSRYSAIDSASCATISRDGETGDYSMRCPGVAGYKLIVVVSDDRASLTIETPSKQTLPLNFWDIVTPTFSTLGEKVEWRLAGKPGKQKPNALIVRVNTVDQTDVVHPKPISFLTVAQFNGHSACLTARIPAEQTDAHKRARKVADAAGQACLPPIKVGNPY